MEENELNLTVNFPAGENVKTLIIRHDNPAKDYDPEILKIEGIITTPSEFLSKRNHLSPPDESHVIFSKKDQTITFVVNEKNKFKTTVIGKLKKHPFISSLKINKDSGYTIKELGEVLRFQRMHFKHKEDHKNLVFKLQNFTAKVETTKTEANDHKGDKSSFINEKIINFTEENAIEFTLLIPLFEGGPKVDIPIRTEIEARAGDVVIFLLYDELDEVIEKTINDLFTEEMEKFAAFPVIEKD